MRKPALALLEPELLLLAYRSGIFPMADSRDDREIYWVEPRRRAILPLDGFRCSRSLARTLRRGRFTVTCNTAFTAVVAACAAPRASEPGTWISERIAASYEALHHAGHAHSIECWHEDAERGRHLAGGLYGVGFDRVFCGESMFSRATDASKVALAWLVAALRVAGTRVLDCQFITPHLASLGAVEISQTRYLALLAKARVQAPGAASPGGGGGASAAGAVGEGTGTAALALPDAFAGLLGLAKSAGDSSSPGNFIAQSFTHTS